MRIDKFFEKTKDCFNKKMKEGWTIFALSNVTNLNSGIISNFSQGKNKTMNLKTLESFINTITKDENLSLELVIRNNKEDKDVTDEFFKKLNDI